MGRGQVLPFGDFWDQQSVPLATAGRASPAAVAAVGQAAVVSFGTVVVLTGRWRALQHFTSPSKIGTIVKAALVLTQFEYGRIK